MRLLNIIKDIKDISVLECPKMPYLSMFFSHRPHKYPLYSAQVPPLFFHDPMYLVYCVYALRRASFYRLFVLVHDNIRILCHDLFRTPPIT